jgi:hypothetical protein
VIHAFRALTESAARSRPDSTPNERLREMAEFYEFIERAMQDGLERWEAERGRPR